MRYYDTRCPPNFPSPAARKKSGFHYREFTAIHIESAPPASARARTVCERRRPQLRAVAAARGGGRCWCAARVSSVDATSTAVAPTAPAAFDVRAPAASIASALSSCVPSPACPHTSRQTSENPYVLPAYRSSMGTPQPRAPSMDPSYLFLCFWPPFTRPTLSDYETFMF